MLQRFFCALGVALVISMVGQLPAVAEPLPPAERTVEFTEAVSQGYISYRIWGSGSAATAHLEIRNHLEVSVEIEIEPGTELVPAEGDVQRLAVTREYKITIKGHVHNGQELVVVKDIDVACLDITLDAPAESNRTWRVRKQRQIHDFLECLDEGIRQAKEESPSSASQLTTLRPFLVQFGLWQARGTTRGQWIDFLVKYHKMTPQQAAEFIDKIKPLLDVIVAQCGSLPNI